MTIGSNTTGSLRYQAVRRKDSGLFRAALMVFLLVGVAVFYVWSHAQVVRVGMRLSELKKEQVRLTEERQRLKMEQISLLSLKRIETYASTKLGMVYPEPSVIRVVREP